MTQVNYLCYCFQSVDFSFHLTILVKRLSPAPAYTGAALFYVYSYGFLYGYWKKLRAVFLYRPFFNAYL